MQSCFTEMAQVFPTPSPSHLCLPFPAMLLVGSYGLLSFSSWISSFGCWISSIKAAYMLVLGVGCYDR
ncbi:U3 small nucleolar RNA-associated protein 20-like [Pyrus ussuriensis x Pyrus communis]|uniref:U3 small nucleolar RNA-associated protein 20-like n=1 Tax=Pyrus ussuriensis x Pyrus communis TaxID=2448454 RepID=A0A5N5GW49_9ROSA|nr:U3 small nucleolar RNA-associated protein 20-like [Pyrus ussuriensis x Pyrus communis]